MKKSEKIFIALCMLAIALRFFNIFGSASLTVVVFLATMLYYLFFTYNSFITVLKSNQTKTTMYIVMLFLWNFGFTTLQFGIMFRLLNYSDWDKLLISGSTYIIIFTVLLLLKINSDKLNVLKPIVYYRVGIWFLLAILVVFLPQVISRIAES